MTGLGYKTRAGAKIQGKPKVYFCCHPDDFDTYFNSISDRILEKINCSIWYKKETPGDYDDGFMSDLELMNLFVMPVTQNLLMTDNCALDVEFRFAIDRGIPVLPLMTDEGLSDIFDKKCGNLHALTLDDAHDKKLDEFLHSVLADDGLIEKIRNAFEAYIFVSYRKKDKKFARELMKLIHENKSYRDIALWYDEFLTPGEDFDDSICDALKKSQIFVMTVTPNLVNETNYVMTTEYPLAKKEKKLIIPVEMQKTGFFSLFRKFKGLPKCVDASDNAAFSLALADAFDKIYRIGHSDSPEHNFLIGLAYLDGIDVEINRERAFSIIKSAAECGLDIAIEKLISMYRKGEGVKRDYDKAVLWQQRYASLLEERYRNTLGCSDGEKWLKELLDLGIFCKQLNMYEAAKEVLLLCEKEMQDFLTRFKDEQYQSSLMAVYDCLYGIYTDEGNDDEAKKYTRKIAVLVGDRLENGGVCQADNMEDKHLINTLAGMAIISGDADSDARAAFDSLVDENIKIAENLYSEEEEDGVLLAKDYDTKASGYERDGDVKNAELYYAKALEIRQKICKKSAMPADFISLFGSYGNLVRLFCKAGGFEKARVYGEDAICILDEIADVTLCSKDKRCLATHFFDLGVICEITRDVLSAEKYYTKATEFISDAAQTNDVCELEALFELCALPSELVICNQKLPVADRYRFVLTDFMEKIAVRLEMPSMIYRLCEKYMSCANHFLLHGEKDYEVQCYSKLIELDCTAGGNAFINALAGGTQSYALNSPYIKLADICEKSGDYDLAEDYLTRNVIILKNLFVANAQAVFVNSYFESIKKLVLFFISRGKHHKADEFVSEITRLCNENFSTDCDIKTDIYINATDLLGFICKQKGDTQSAALYYAKVVELCRSNIKKSDPFNPKAGHTDCIRMVMAYLNLGQVSQGEQKKEILNEGLSILRLNCDLFENIRPLYDSVERSFLSEIEDCG